MHRAGGEPAQCGGGVRIDQPCKGILLGVPLSQMRPGSGFPLLVRTPASLAGYPLQSFTRKAAWPVERMTLFTIRQTDLMPLRLILMQASSSEKSA
jgi:hypothetical protein